MANQNCIAHSNTITWITILKVTVVKGDRGGQGSAAGPISLKW